MLAMNTDDNIEETPTLTSEVITESIDDLDLGDMSGEKNYLAALKNKLNGHWSNVKEKLNEDVALKVEYTGVGAEPFIKLGKNIKKIALTDLGDMSGEKNYLAGLKRHINNQLTTVKEKLNEDVSLKVEYTGIGTEPFFELGRKVKSKFSKTTNVMVLGQDRDCMPVIIDSSTNIKSIPLQGHKYDYKLDTHRYNYMDKKLKIRGSSSGHSIENIINKNIEGTDAFIIYISLASNDPLDEFYEYMEMIEKHEIKDVYFLVAFLHENLNQHDAMVMIDAITADYKDIGIIHVNTLDEEMNVVLNLVVENFFPETKQDSTEFDNDAFLDSLGI